MKWGLPLLLLSALSLPVSAYADEPLVADFRYAPVWWQTLIGLVDDPQKTLVGKDGELLYDYRGGHNLRDFGITVRADLEGGSTWVRQEFLSPRVPIVRTTRRQGDVVITQEAFTLPPAPDNARSLPGLLLALERIGANTRIEEFALPSGEVDPAFRRAAVGWDQPIRYRFRARPGRTYRVALGLCEGYWREPGRRTLNLRIEGESRRTVDIVKERGPNVPGVYLEDASDLDRDGFIEVTVAPAEGATDRNTILNALWVFDPATAPAESDLIRGVGKNMALAATPGAEPQPVRCDLIRVTFRNTGPIPATITPTVDSEGTSAAGFYHRGMMLGPATSIVCSRLPAGSPVPTSTGTRQLFLSTTLGPGAETSFTVCVVRNGDSPDDIPDLEKFQDLRARAERYWKSVSLPYDVIRVPDPGIQSLLDSSIRNIYQAREIKNGLPAFQVGPTVYRGLWIVDGAFLLDAATLLGRTREARNGIEYLLGFQRDDGGFMLIGGYWKETGIVLWAVTRHARLTADRAWLRTAWPRVRTGVAYIQKPRRETLADPEAPNYGLVPAGFSDGGLAGSLPEYTNVYWSLIGLKSAVEAARWLGEDEDARAWQKEYDDFDAAFRKAAGRDSRIDARGNRILPVRMVDPDNVAPQRGQWAFLHAVYPGKLFERNDPIQNGNMAMLRATEQEGMVFGSGWLADGIWNYLASFYGHAWLWLGDGRKAAGSLYAFANHAAPVLVWREEQYPRGRGDGFVGDMPHNWASAEFVRLVRNMLVLERGSELHLLEGMPAEWAAPGKVTRLDGAMTEFGPASLTLAVAPDGRTARLELDPPRRSRPSRVVLHLDGWSGEEGTRCLPVSGRTSSTIRLKPR